MSVCVSLCLPVNMIIQDHYDLGIRIIEFIHHLVSRISSKSLTLHMVQAKQNLMHDFETDFSFQQYKLIGIYCKLSNGTYE